MSILILQGLPGSGKTTFREKWLSEAPNRKVINYDDTRLLMYGKGWKFNYDEEDAMKKACMVAAREAMTAGCDLIIDNTNLQPRHYEKWIQLANEFKTTCEVMKIDTPLHVCVDADKNRTKRVGRAVIEGMALRNNMIKWADFSLYNGSDFIILDVDGTVADLSHRRPLITAKCTMCGQTEAWTKKGACAVTGCNGARTKKDYDGFFALAAHDQPFNDIIHLMQILNDNFKIIVVSGRPDDKCGIITENWLTRYGVPYEHLFMRRGGDYRPDDEVKQEILDLLPKKRIKYVFDDRDRVVQMWRKNGLRCLQVAEGAF